MYAILFRYTVAPDLTASFEEHYGSEGAWARLFQRAPGFVRTELYAEEAVRGAYLTLDLWETERHYRDFMGTDRSAYDALDVQLAGLSQSQECLGRYVLLGR